MNNWQQQILVNVADIKLSNVDKIRNTDEKVVRLCNYTDVYRNSFINREKAQCFMIASCDENEFEKFILKKGQVAITKDSETTDDIGVSSFIQEDFDDVVLGYHLSLITPFDDKLDGRFLHYWLNTKQAKRYFENNAGGSGQRCTLTLDCIKSMPIHLPDIITQKVIGKILFDLDIKIELNKRDNAVLEAMAKTIYDYWFVQFDFPDKNGKPFKSSCGKMVRDKKLRREIPEGWKVGVLSDIATLIRGVTYDKTQIKRANDQNVIPILRATNITGNKIDLENMVYLPNSIVSEEQILNKYNIIIVMSSGSKDHIGKNGFYYFENKVAFGAFCAKLKAKKDCEFYLHSFMQSEIMFKMIQNECLGTNINNLNGTLVNNFKVIIPDNIILYEYNKTIKPLYEKIRLNYIENKQLTELRDWLLPMLMNGQVKVK